ncbi:GGDEF domain-containing protein [Marinobacterium rhizophilum]|uniref:diguanylate cyclase n=1 Tax=Marinobacterium rhizophilum TaxID=420402 RepID=A0ABY5HNP1_9GAMM|nr:GGDEF domain-containing protein [Marinobacterium rhizophilum]UTW13734.1 GGDEF domain-containing protein [Marinobacterium rhizophilum]
MDNHKYLNKRRLLREFLLSCLILLIIFYIVSRLDLSEKLYAFSRAYEVIDLDDMLFSLGLFLPIYMAIFAVRRFGELTILVRESSTDSLTGLINHRRVQALLAQEVSRAQRFRRPLSVVLFDIDNFKDVNDSHGHPVGDAVLRQVASLLSSAVRSVDYLARTGGEEFMLIATETEGALAQEVAERMRLILSNADFGIGRPVTASFGVSQLRRGETVAALLQRADERLYWSKRDGRNRVCGIKNDTGSKSA